MKTFMKQTLYTLLSCCVASSANASESGHLQFPLPIPTKFSSSTLDTAKKKSLQKRAVDAKNRYYHRLLGIAQEPDDRAESISDTASSVSTSPVSLQSTTEDYSAVKKIRLARQRLLAQKAVRKAARDAYLAKKEMAYREKLRKRYAAISKHHMPHQHSDNSVINDAGVSLTEQRAPKTGKSLYQKLKEITLLRKDTDKAVVSSSPTDAAEFLDNDGASTTVFSEIPRLAPRFKQLKTTIKELNKVATGELDDKARRRLLATRNLAFWSKVHDLISRIDIVDAKEMHLIKQMVDQARHAARTNKINTHSIESFPDIDKALQTIFNPKE